MITGKLEGDPENVVSKKNWKRIAAKELSERCGRKVKQKDLLYLGEHMRSGSMRIEGTRVTTESDGITFHWFGDRQGDAFPTRQIYWSGYVSEKW